MQIDNEPKLDTEGKRVLSQWEIDSLLGSLGSTERQEATAAFQPERNVRPYDFRRPDKFSKEHLRALQTIHEAFARIAASSLSAHLRTSIQMRVSSVEQAVYGEYIEQLANPTVINIVSADPLPGRMIIEVNYWLAFALIDRLMGGTGQVAQKPREVTDIEMVLLRTLVGNLMRSLHEAWLQMLPVNLNLEDLLFNPEIVQAALPGDVGVLLLFELRLGEASNIISMFIPYAMLEPVTAKLSSQIWFTAAHKDVVAAQDDTRRQLEKVELPVVVNLGTSTVSVREMLGLQKGNVIRLDASANQDLEVLVGGRHKFKARPGRVSRRLAVVITKAVLEDEPKKTEAPEVALARIE